MGLLSRLFGSKDKSKNGPPKQEVEIFFAYGSTNFQYVFALGDQLHVAVSEAKAGEYDGHEIASDGSECKLFLFGPDAETIFRVITPVLEASPLTRGAVITLRFGPRGWRTPKRTIKLPQ